MEIERIFFKAWGHLLPAFSDHAIVAQSLAARATRRRTTSWNPTTDGNTGQRREDPGTGVQIWCVSADT